LGSNKLSVGGSVVWKENWGVDDEGRGGRGKGAREVEGGKKNLYTRAFEGGAL